MSKQTPIILLVEDDPSFGRLLEWVMEGIAEIVRVETREDALAQVEAFTPAVILSDLYLPTLDGIELFEELKSHPRAGSVPFALLTGSAEQAGGPHIQRAANAGLDRIFYKDAGLDGLRDLISELLPQED